MPAPLRYRFYSFADKTMYNVASIDLPLDGRVIVNGSLVVGTHGVLMQASGVKDSVTGKSVFEGDIAKITVENEFGSFEIRYGVMRFNTSDGHFCFDFESEYDLMEPAKVEIIGDMFSTPHLVPDRSGLLPEKAI